MTKLFDMSAAFGVEINAGITNKPHGLIKKDEE